MRCSLIERRRAHEEEKVDEEVSPDTGECCETTINSCILRLGGEGLFGARE